MKGHRQIIEARRRGLLPVCAFVSVGRAPGFRSDWFENEIAEGALPEVWTDGDCPETADLRWSHALRLHMSPCDGTDAELLLRWTQAFEAAGARFVVIVTPDGEPVFMGEGVQA